MRSTWRAALDAALVADVPMPLPDGVVPVIMCTWRRPERLHRTIGMLRSQRDAPPIRLLVWNNHWANRHRCAYEVEAGGAGEALESVELVDASRNLGGIARFVLMRRLLRSGYRGPVITIDDDMELGDRFVADLLASHRDRSVHGIWAFRMHGGYWDRDEVAIADEAADYLGTGGAVIDVTIVEDDAFFDRLPDRYGCNEDLWMSRWAHGRGWELRKAVTSYEFVVDDRNQGSRVDGRKQELWSIADRLVRGERIPVGPDPDGGAARVGAVEAVGAWCRSVPQRLGVGRALLRLRGRR